ncbi:GNAT family N-acetyltransferase [Paenibacillus koleovorans]|uniref:GNAT family N-acetyltransferase n=1 Tax=Paenibacillus koleovorans TaxID=121608 RepID=UPI0027D8E04A|nr:GNAT family protein [Paenibacillus koleovorans]
MAEAGAGVPLRLETSRLILRDFVAEDEAAVHEYASDPEVTRHMLWGPNTEAETREFLQRTIGALQVEGPRQVYELALVRRSDGRLIGGCGLHREGTAAAELGYCLSRGVWGQGYAVEAAQALVRFGFAELGLHRIYAKCRPANVGSYRVMEKLGMQREGLLREHLHVKGAWHDSLLYSILAHEI